MRTCSNCITATGLTMALFLASALVAVPSTAQEPEEWSGDPFEIVVTAPRIEIRETRRPGARGSRVSASYTVNFADLDLTSESDRVELEERVNEAANEICLLLTERYDEPRATAARCEREAIDDAMSQVQTAIEAAEEQ